MEIQFTNLIKTLNTCIEYHKSKNNTEKVNELTNKVNQIKNQKL